MILSLGGYADTKYNLYIILFLIILSGKKKKINRTVKIKKILYACQLYNTWKNWNLEYQISFTDIGPKVLSFN